MRESQSPVKALLAALLAAALLCGCTAGTGDSGQSGGTPSESATESVTATEPATEATEATDPETEPPTEPAEPELAVHTVGDVQVALPADAQVSYTDQNIMGVTANIMMITHGSAMAMVGSTRIAGLDVDADEATLDSGINGMVNNLKQQAPSAQLHSESETDYVEYGGNRWAHRSVVVTAAGDDNPIDMFVINSDQGQYTVILVTPGGDNDDIIRTVMDNLTIVWDDASGPEDADGAEAAENTEASV